MSFWSTCQAVVQFPKFAEKLEVRPMQIIRSLPLLIELSFNATPLLSQNVNTMHPEEISAQKHPSPDDMRARAANVQLQKDAKELAELCSSVSSDMDGVTGTYIERPA